jgi:Ca-activated chloride channel family protein
VRSLADYAELTGKPEIIEEVTEIGLKYELLTPYTSTVAVDELPRKTAEAAVPVNQPMPLPSGIGNGAIGGSLPEPDTFILIALALIATTLMRIR